MTSQTITTAGSGTFTVPDFVTSLTIEAWGAGGGGAGGNSADGAGGGGGGYSLAIVSVIAGRNVFYHVGAHGAGGNVGGNNGEDSWVNPSANIEPTSNGVVGGGGGGGPAGSGTSVGGVGSIGTTNFNGGTGAQTDGGGGGCAGSAGGGSNGAGAGGGSLGGAGGSPDGGAGGNGSAATGTAGFAPGGGGGGNEDSLSNIGFNGADGQVRFTWTANPPFGPLVSTTLTKGVPGKQFTKKQFSDLLDDLRESGTAKVGLTDLERMELEFAEAQAAAKEADDQLLGKYNYTSYGKAQDAKERLKELQEKRNRHYYMEAVKKAWDEYNKK